MYIHEKWIYDRGDETGRNKGMQGHGPIREKVRLMNKET